MRKRLGFFGIGLFLVLFGLVYFVNAFAISLEHRELTLLFVNRKIDEHAGMLIYLLGVLWIAAAGWSFVRGWIRRELVTTGLYRLCRHPIYAGLILLIHPALGLISHSWLVMSEVAVLYLCFKWWIKREDRALEAAFGPDYLAYRARTNELFPWPRRQLQ